MSSGICARCHRPYDDDDHCLMCKDVIVCPSGGTPCKKVGPY